MAASLPHSPHNTLPMVTALAHARAAFGSIQSHGLAPVPCHYAVWFEHHSGGRPELTAALQAAVAAGTVDEALMRDLHARFLEAMPEFSALSDALTRLSGTLSEAMGTMASHGADTAAFGDALDELSAAPVHDSQRLRAALSHLADKAREMTRRSLAMGNRLADSTHQIENLRAELHDARRDALTDALTSLPNRRAFDERLEAMAATASDEPLTLVLVDIDHFKRVNDQFGHPVGDALLRRTAATIRGCLPATGMAARFGGEEFAVLLPSTPPAAGFDQAEKTRLAVAAQRLALRSSGERLSDVTVSLGVATLLPGESVTEMVARADAALYRAKQEGRNRVCSSDAVTPAMPAPGCRAGAGRLAKVWS